MGYQELFRNKISVSSVGGGDGTTTSESVVSLKNVEAVDMLQGQVVYASGNKEVGLAIANSNDTANAFGFCGELILPNNSGKIITDGIITIPNSNLAYVCEEDTLEVGKKYFLSHLNKGKISKNSPPDIPGLFVVTLGTCISPTEIEVEIQNPIEL